MNRSNDSLTTVTDEESTAWAAANSARWAGTSASRYSAPITNSAPARTDRDRRGGLWAWRGIVRRVSDLQLREWIRDYR